MGIKGKVIALAASAIIGYLIGRGDGQDIEAYKNAVDRIGTLEKDNQHLSDQVTKMKKQAGSMSTALNKRTSEVDALRKKIETDNRKLSNAGKKNSDWASQPVPDDIANILRTPRDNKDG